MITADKILSEDQLKKLIAKMKAEKDKALLVLKGDSSKAYPGVTRIISDYYFFTLIANTGLRISEALKLNLSDLGIDFITIRGEISKNGKRGTIFFGDKTKLLLNEYLRFRSSLPYAQNTNVLFPSKSRSNISNRSYLHTRFKHWLKITNLPSHLSIHSLRHTYGTLCLDKGLSLTFVRDNLRHSNISITSQYLHLTKENRQKIKNIF